MHCFGPSFNAPRLLSSDLALFQIRELPKMVDSVQVANLNEPSSHTFHHFPACLEAASPMCLPLQQISRVKSVGSKFKKSSQTAGWSCWPERELLHQRRSLALDQALQLPIEFGEFWMAGNLMERGVVSFVPLVFPDVNCKWSEPKLEMKKGMKDKGCMLNSRYQKCHCPPLGCASCQPGSPGFLPSRPCGDTTGRLGRHTHVLGRV